jgi:xanthine dehydrogenase accessory factor
MPSVSTLTAAEAAHRLLSALNAGVDVVSFTILTHVDPAAIGRRVLWEGQELVGSFQDERADEATCALARAGLSGETDARAGLQEITFSDGSSATLYMEVQRPPSEMVIVGAGHLAQPLSTLGSQLGLEVLVLDDRPEFATRERFPEAREVKRVDFADPFQTVPLHRWSHVLLVTRGHRYDYECLRKVLQHDPLPRYVGMIGSRRRVRATFQALLDEGFSRELLAQVRAPIGLDIGAETPAEIAVAVAAEIVQFWRGGSCRPLQEVENVLQRFSRESKPGAQDGLPGGSGP